jgi:hypothetical protein
MSGIDTYCWRISEKGGGGPRRWEEDELQVHVASAVVGMLKGYKETECMLSSGQAPMPDRKDWALLSVIGATKDFLICYFRK